MVWKIMATLITLGQTLIECFVCINVLNVLNNSSFELSPFLQMDNRISLWKKYYREPGLSVSFPSKYVSCVLWCLNTSVF